MGFLADVSVSGEGLVHNALVFFIIILCLLIVWALGHFGFPKVKAPGFVIMVWDGIWCLLAAILVINFLMSLIGHGFIKW
jgi:hypothetical protein